MQKKQQIYLIASILSILLIAGIMFYLYNHGSFSFLSISGASTLSLQKVDLQSNFAPLNGKAWLLTFTSGKLGQSYYGSFDSDEVVDGESTATKDFSISVEYEDQSCSYDIVQSSSSVNLPIYNELKMITWNCLSIPSLSDAQSKFGSGKILSYGKDSSFVGINSCYAVGSATQSPIGVFSSPDVEAEYTVSIDVGGKIATKKLSTSSGSNKGMLGDFAYVVDNGGLVSGQSCPDKDPYIAYYYNGRWYIGNSEDYKDYKDVLYNLVAQNDRGTREDLLNLAKTLASASKSGGASWSIDSSTSLSSASAKTMVSTPIIFPLTSLYIKASTLGIYTPSSKVKLYNGKSECFTTGEQGSIEVIAENTGDELWTGTLYAECTSPFASSRNVQLSLNEGESKTIFIPLTAEVSSKKTSNCIVYAEGVGSSDDLRVGVCSTPQITCTAGQQFCSTNGDRAVIKKCSQDGATSTIVTTCGNGEICQNLECISSSSTGGANSGCAWYDIPCKISSLFEVTLNFLIILKWVIIIIVSIVSIFISADLLEKIRSLEEIQPLRWTIAVLIAVSIGVLLYSFIGSFWFWVCSIGVVIYLIFGATIKSYLHLG